MRLYHTIFVNNGLIGVQLPKTSSMINSFYNIIYNRIRRLFQ